MSNAERDPIAETVGPVTEEQLIAQGWDPEYAKYLVKFDAAVQGEDASIVIPVTAHALENMTGAFTPEAMRQVASLFQEAAVRIGQRAAAIEQGLKEHEQDNTVEANLQVVQSLPHGLN
jgi:hypothetical protein